MTNKRSEDIALDSEIDALFAEASQTQPIPSAALLARVAQDAKDVQDNITSEPVPRIPELPAWRQWLSEIGGFPALGGLAVSAIVGGYIGFVNPQMTLSVQSVAENDATVDAEDPFSTPMLGDLEWISEG